MLVETNGHTQPRLHCFFRSGWMTCRQVVSSVLMYQKGLCVYQYAVPTGLQKSLEVVGGGILVEKFDMA
jgi:hypothetical protein